MCIHPQRTKLDEFLDRWCGISAHAATRMLIRLGYGRDVMDWARPEKSPIEVLNSVWFENMRARDVGEFRFMAGPPKRRRLIRGTLLMLLADRLMYAYVTICPLPGALYSRTGC